MVFLPVPPLGGESRHTESPGQFSFHPHERHVTGGQKHERVVDEVGRFGNDAVVTFAAGGGDEFTSLLGHLWSAGLDATSQESAGVGSIRVASLSRRDHALEAFQHFTQTPHQSLPKWLQTDIVA
jgi:hypothetical protein